VISQANRGVCAARNLGVASTSAEFLVFTDHDDRLLPTALETGLQAFAEHPECAFVYGNSVSIDEEGHRLAHGCHGPSMHTSYERLLAGDALVPPGCAMFRRSSVEAVGGFLEGTFPSEDYDLYLRASRESPVYCHNREVVEYRRHAGNASRNATRQLRGTLATLDRQRPYVVGNATLERALAQGRAHWGRVFAPAMAFEAMDHLRAGNLAEGARIVALTLRSDPRSVMAMLRHFFRRSIERLQS
jgi:hypothetical protein